MSHAPLPDAETDDGSASPAPLVDATVDAGEPRRKSLQNRDFPQDLPRYRYVGFLGEGGMGQVFQAFDQTLQRTVALKFVRHADPDLARRLVREAAAQARIEHPHICKVFDVGEAQGRPYVAMQFIAGQTLGQLAGELNLAQKVRLVQQAAEAMHAAHRQGLIHRDLKPANILVETREDGQLHPYVVDFGLARDARASDQTQVGAVQGTPQYMPPEQARGEEVDRRSDVYSLGATLYALLAGRPPFAGTSTLQVLVQVAQDEAPPLHRFLPTVPRDLQTVVMKCLERDPSRRYDSARALAEDLGRYLDGGPVHAQADHFAYRWRKKLRKHRVLATVIALAIVLLVGALGLAWQARRRADEVAAIAQQFSQQSEALAGRMRLAWLLPAHDIRPERAEVRRSLALLRQDMLRLGPPAQGPGHLALGQGLLAIQDHEGALREFQAAWQAGQRGPDVVQALGTVWTDLDDRMKDDSGRWQTPGLAGRTETSVRAEALRWLGQLPADRQTAVGAATLESLQERPHGEAGLRALAMVEQATRRDPMDWQAWTLQGKLVSKLGHKAAEAGRFPQAVQLYAQADEALGHAVEIARSHPEPLAQRCRLHERVLELPVAVTETRARLRQGIEACATAMRVDPDDDRNPGKLAALYLAQARLDREQGEPAQHLDEAERLARQALTLAPQVAGRARTLAEVLTAKGLAQTDGEPALSEAQAVLERALANRPEPGRRYRVWLALAEVHRARASQGREVRRELEAAWDALEQARALAPHDYPALPLRLEVALTRASETFDGAVPPDPEVRRVREALQALEPRGDTDPRALLARAKAWMWLGQQPGQGGVDPQRRALAAVREAERLRPGWRPAQDAQVEIRRESVARTLRPSPPP